ncbi:MAG: thymidylate synthase [Solobacterium sp.]|nr:thymidylate synthase [Solobacterium sp.]
MSYADEVFIEMCMDILENGTSTEGQKVRPHWPDGTPAYTIMKFGEINRFDLRKEFPMLTLRKTGIKSATDEVLWIWQKKSNNIHDLGPHIWDEWADESGSIGKAYGYQMGVKHPCKDVSEEGLIAAFPSYYAFSVNEDGERVFLDQETGRVAAVKRQDRWYVDQVDKVIYDLKNTPFSRRIMTTIWNPEDLDEMNLQPCAYSVTFVVSQVAGEDRLTLNMILNQRSQDILAAWAWNTCQYAVLQHMIAQVCDMNVGEFIHIDANAHIYAPRHIPAIRELISRTPQPAPEFVLDPEIHDFYRFTKDSVSLKNYVVAGDQITNIEIAV